MTRDEVLKEYALIKADPLYFLKYVKIQEPGSLALEYELWPHLKDFFGAMEVFKLIKMVKSKQIGISWAIAIRALRMLLTVPGANILEISSGEEESKKLLKKSRIVYDNLPEWMKIWTIEPDSTEQFGFKELKSIARALPSTKKAGIGETAGWVIHDEADFHEYFELNVGHTLATVADHPDRKLTVVSTTEKRDPESHFKQLMREDNSFHTIFYPYNVRPNRGKEWRLEQERQLVGQPWVMEGNFPRTIEEALSPLSVQSCFRKEVLERLWNCVEEDPETENTYIFILQPPRVGVTYAAGADVGEGVGLDYSCLSIIGKEGLHSEVVAIIYTNQIATDMFAYEVNELCKKYYTPLLAVENNSLGGGVLNKLLELGYSNLYYTDAERRKMGKIGGIRSKPGWYTGDTNKTIAMVELIQDINNGALISRFKSQVIEMTEQQWVNGKPEPTGKTHGDTIISLMLAHQMLKESRAPIKSTQYIGGELV